MMGCPLGGISTYAKTGPTCEVVKVSFVHGSIRFKLATC